jgi:Holliday junction resolvase
LNTYQERFCEQTTAGISVAEAAALVAEKYLDGKHSHRGKHKITQSDRDNEFWSAAFLAELPTEIWSTDVMILALSRYLDQERVSAPQLIASIARSQPSAICRAIRYARMVYQPKVVRMTELREVATYSPEIHEQCLIIDIFLDAYSVRQAEIDKWQQALADLSPFELLIYASLFAFEYLIPGRFANPEQNIEDEGIWYALTNLIAWKLETSTDTKISLSEKKIGMSMAEHLAPFLFPGRSGMPPRFDLMKAFNALLAAQVEMNEFISRSVDAHSYDDAVRFVRHGERLEIEITDQSIRARWERDGRRMLLCHGYWLYRAIEVFASSEIANHQIGTPENHEANQLAYIRALRTKLELEEVYGINDSVLLESGERVNLFQALLSLELTSAFFQRDYLAKFGALHAKSGNSATALSELALQGLMEGMQNRFPLTWSEREQKIRSIVGWTVCDKFPKGSLPMAASILDFWTNDWQELAARLRSNALGLVPEILERPFLKLGGYFVQLPWVTGLQNNSTAAINNLRRLGARRGEAQEETRRIERSLGKLFESRGFKVIQGFHPDSEAYPEVGEIDLICARDGIVLVIEVKSSFRRRSQREAWLHGKTTLRKAGQQLRRKVEAVSRMLASEPGGAVLGLTNPCAVKGIIADTSIEHDHERFNGFLKVSVEEILIALRDDRKFLADPIGVLGKTNEEDGDGTLAEKQLLESLYLDGFNALRFVEVLENELVWLEADSDATHLMNGG